jgi:hypothetical protein
VSQALQGRKGGRGVVTLLHKLNRREPPLTMQVVFKAHLCVSSKHEVDTEVRRRDAGEPLHLREHGPVHPTLKSGMRAIDTLFQKKLSGPLVAKLLH